MMSLLLIKLKLTIHQLINFFSARFAFKKNWFADWVTWYDELFDSEHSMTLYFAQMTIILSFYSFLIYFVLIFAAKANATFIGLIVCNFFYFLVTYWWMWFDYQEIDVVVRFRHLIFFTFITNNAVLLSCGLVQYFTTLATTQAGWWHYFLFAIIFGVYLKCIICSVFTIWCLVGINRGRLCDLQEYLDTHFPVFTHLRNGPIGVYPALRPLGYFVRPLVPSYCTKAFSGVWKSNLFQFNEFGLAFLFAVFGVRFALPGFVETTTAHIAEFSANVFNELMLFVAILFCSLTYFKSVNAELNGGKQLDRHFAKMFLYNLISLFTVYAAILFLNLVVSNNPSKYSTLFYYYFANSTNMHTQEHSLLAIKVFYLILCSVGLFTVGKYFFKNQTSHQYLTLIAFVCWVGLFVMNFNNIVYILVLFDVLSLLTISIVVLSTTPDSTKTLNYSLNYFGLSVFTSFIAYLGSFMIHTSLRTLNINAIVLAANSIFMENYFDNRAFLLGAFLILIKFAFLFGLFPFHQYVIEISSVVSFGFLIVFLVVTKLPVLVCFAGLLKILWLKFLAFKTFIYLVGFSSIVFSAIFIATCPKIKTFFAYSSINQGGFVLILLSFEDFVSVIVAAQFFAVYAIATTLIFLILASTFNLNRAGVYENDFDSWSDLVRCINDSWSQALVFKPTGTSVNSQRWNLILFISAASFSLLTLGGFPPFAGFFLKLSLIEIFLIHKYTATLFLIVVSTLITMYAYFNVIMLLMVDTKEHYYNTAYVGTKIFNIKKSDSNVALIFIVFLTASIGFSFHTEWFWLFAEKVALYFYDVNFYNFDTIKDIYTNDEGGLILETGEDLPATAGPLAAFVWMSFERFKDKAWVVSRQLRSEGFLKTFFSSWLGLKFFAIVKKFKNVRAEQRADWNHMSTRVEVPITIKYPTRRDDYYCARLKRPYNEFEILAIQKENASVRAMIIKHEKEHSKWFIGNSFIFELTVLIIILSIPYVCLSVWAWESLWNCAWTQSERDVAHVMDLFQDRTTMFWMFNRIFCFTVVSYFVFCKLLLSVSMFRWMYLNYMLVEAYCLIFSQTPGVSWYWSWILRGVEDLFSFFGCDDLLGKYFKNLSFWYELFYFFIGLPFIAILLFVIYSGFNSRKLIKDAYHSDWGVLKAFRELLVSIYNTARVVCYTSPAGGHLLYLINLVFVWFVAFGPLIDIVMSGVAKIGPFLLIKSIYTAVKFLSLNFFVLYFAFISFWIHWVCAWLFSNGSFKLFRRQVSKLTWSYKDLLFLKTWNKIRLYSIYILVCWVIPAAISLNLSISISLWNIYSAFLFEVNAACAVWVALSALLALGLALSGHDDAGSNLAEFKKACLSVSFGMSIFFLNLMTAYYIEVKGEFLAQKIHSVGSVAVTNSAPFFSFSFDGMAPLVSNQKFTMFTFGFDYLSLLFCTMTSIVFTFSFMAILVLKNIKHERLFCALLFLIKINILGAFLSVNFLAFFVFFEASLAPLAILIGKWGSSNKKWFAAKQFLMYSLIGSLPMTVFVVYLYMIYGSLDYVHLIENISMLTSLEKYTFWFCLFFMLAVKVPMFPFHSWLLSAHVEAPMVGSIILAAITLKLGIYGMVRFLLGALHQISIEVSSFVCGLCLIGIFFSAVASITETDAKRLIAQTSIAHMNLVVLGLFTGDSRAFFGAVFLAVGHAVTSTALFFLIGVLYDRFHTRELSVFGGLVHLMPLFSTALFFFVFANAGFPWSLSFLGEFMILLGIGRELSFFVFVILIISSVLLLYANLRLFISICFGTLNKDLISNASSDLNALELICVGLLLGFSFSLLLNNFTIFNPLFTDYLLKYIL